jgi:hypothetical protein
MYPKLNPLPAKQMESQLEKTIQITEMKSYFET